jgi:hypothetical protein
MIKSANSEFLILGNEKDMLKFYHANFLDNFKDSEIDFKLLSSISENSLYIFDDSDRAKIRMMPSDIQNNLCFLIKDNKEIVFFIKNASQVSNHMTAMWTDSETLIYSMKMLFDSIWFRSKNIHL